MKDTSFSPILTLDQAADYLQVTVGELYTELESGRIPGLKVAGHWRIKRQALDRLLDSAAGEAELSKDVATLSRLQKILSQQINLLTRSCLITPQLFASVVAASAGECIDRRSQLTGQWTPSHDPLRRLF